MKTNILKALVLSLLITSSFSALAADSQQVEGNAQQEVKTEVKANPQTQALEQANLESIASQLKEATYKYVKDSTRIQAFDEKRRNVLYYNKDFGALYQYCIYSATLANATNNAIPVEKLNTLYYPFAKENTKVKPLYQQSYRLVTAYQSLITNPAYSLENPFFTNLTKILLHLNARISLEMHNWRELNKAAGQEVDPLTTPGYQISFMEDLIPFYFSGDPVAKLDKIKVLGGEYPGVIKELPEQQTLNIVLFNKKESDDFRDYHWMTSATGKNSCYIFLR